MTQPDQLVTIEDTSFKGQMELPEQAIHVLAIMDAYRVTGPAKQLLALAGYRRDRLRFTLATFRRGREESPFLQAARAAGLPTVIIPDRFPGDPSSLFNLAEAVRTYRPDILQTHGYKPNVLGRLLVKRLRVPWVAFLHGETWENWKVRAYFACERVAIRKADRIIAVSRCMGDHALKCGAPMTRLRVVHNAYLTLPADIGHEKGWNTSVKPIVGYVSRLSPEKGVDVALQVHRLVVQQRPDVQLVIAGEGSLLATLQQQADRLGLGSSVQWLGYRNDMDEWYKKMTVLLVAYQNEGLPNAMLEAMGHGVPVVAVALGGIPEVITNAMTGFLVPSITDIQTLADRIVALLNDPVLCQRIGEEGRQTVRQRFSLDARAMALINEYLELLG